jgi:hypothetical protein
MTLIGQPDEIIVKASYLDQLGIFLCFNQIGEGGYRRQLDRVKSQIPCCAQYNITPRGDHFARSSVHNAVVGFNHTPHASIEWEPNEDVTGFGEG